MSNVIECHDCPEYDAKLPRCLTEGSCPYKGKPFNRQAMFRPDGSITSVPTRLTERPSYKQLNLGL